MTRNEIILMILCILIYIFIVYITVVIIANFVNAHRRMRNRLFNPNKLPVYYYQKDEAGRDRIVSIEEISERDLIGTAYYTGDSIQFYIDDKRELNHKN